MSQFREAARRIALEYPYSADYVERVLEDAKGDERMARVSLDCGVSPSTIRRLAERMSAP